jgi:hypothetical protein
MGAEEGDGPRQRGLVETGGCRVTARRPAYASVAPRVAAAALCVAALVIGAALLAGDSGRGASGGGEVSLLQERLSVGINIAKAFDRTWARSEEDEGGQIKVHRAHDTQQPPVAPAPAAETEAHAHARVSADQRELDRQTQDSEEWSGKKLRDMVARLFRAVAAMDERSNVLNRRDHREYARLKSQDESDLKSSQQQVESRIVAAASQLKAVLHGERTMRHIITEQESVGEAEHRQTSKEVKAFSAEVQGLKHKLAKEQREVLALRNKASLHDDGAGDDAVAHTLSTLLSATGVERELDEWCSHKGKCC